MKLILKILKLVVLLLPFIFLIPAFLLKFGYVVLFHKEMPLEMISDMDYQMKLKSQSFNSFIEDSIFPFYPPPNTIPSNYEPYRFEQIEFEKAELKYRNPFSDSSSRVNLVQNVDTASDMLKRKKFILERGKYLFETFCIYCHGQNGQGDGQIITKVELKNDEEGFPIPPKLTDEKTKIKSDARLFHILSAGQNLMFPVADRLSESDRWILVNYIRWLQSR